ncbi:MAG: hypothetical protein JNM17_26710 [Archangium sp.]|nr:hypothetical protein [Archangium sp.]
MGKKHDASEIEVLDGLEPIRRRPELYAGDVASSKTTNRLVLEAMCLAVHEKSAELVQAIAVSVTGDRVRIDYGGPGLPLGKYPGSKLTFIEALMTVLFSCRDAKTTEAARSLCGIGITVTNALSSWCTITVQREGAVWKQRYERGRATGPLKRIGKTKTSGTVLEFEIDRSLLKAPLDLPALRRALKKFERVVPCVRVQLDAQG